ncbi:MAG: hypothetical protein AAFQ58_19295 [Pseudomonadota bacterium]
MTDFDVWWADQDCGNLDVKDICRKQWVTMERNGLDCSTITQIMDNAWAGEFERRTEAFHALIYMGQEFDTTEEPSSDT